MMSFNPPMHPTMRTPHTQVSPVIRFVLAITLASVTSSVRASLASEVIDGILKLSGKAAGAGEKLAAREALERGMAKYGEEAVKMAERGGYELPEAAARHGDKVWHLAFLSAEAPKAVAARPEKLLKMAERWGDTAALIEIKAPGTGEVLACRLGRVELQELALGASNAEIKRFAALATHRSPRELEAARKVWRRGGGAVLEQLTPERIAAMGFSAALLTVAWKAPSTLIGFAESVLTGLLGPVMTVASWAVLLLVLLVLHRPVLWLAHRMPLLARDLWRSARQRA